MNKPATPYQRLLNAVRRFHAAAKYPPRKMMFFVPKDKLSEGWALQVVADKTETANQLGWAVEVKVESDGLRFEYVKRPDDIDYFIG